MIGLRTARVLVVDDNPAEALPIIQALGKLGIGSIYVAGDRLEELPGPLTGVRVIFLDMKLGVEGDDKTAIATCINVLKKLVGDDPGPTVIVVWTMHPNVVDGFKEALSKELPKLRPGIVARLKKPVELEGARVTFGKADLGETDAKVREALEDNAPLEVLWHWEQVVHLGASGTTAALLELVSSLADRVETKDEKQAAQAWQQQLAQVMKWLLDTADSSSTTYAEVYQALKTVLGSILHDRVEHERALALPSGIKAVAQIAKSKAPLPIAATLNTRILTAAVGSSDITVRPGNLYRAPAIFGLNVVRLADDVLLNNAMQQKLSESRKGNNTETTSKLEQELELWLKAAAAKCTAVALEVTPVCDYAQGKNYVSKFIAGLLVPHEEAGKLKWNKESAKILPWIMPFDDKKIVCCVLSSRFTFGLGDPGNTLKDAPLFRFRAPVVVDVQAWSSSQAARPGLLSVNV